MRPRRPGPPELQASPGEAVETRTPGDDLPGLPCRRGCPGGGKCARSRFPPVPTSLPTARGKRLPTVGSALASAWEVRPGTSRRGGGKRVFPTVRGNPTDGPPGGETQRVKRTSTTSTPPAALAHSRAPAARIRPRGPGPDPGACCFVSAVLASETGETQRVKQTSPATPGASATGGATWRGPRTRPLAARRTADPPTTPLPSTTTPTGRTAGAWGRGRRVLRRRGDRVARAPGGVCRMGNPPAVGSLSSFARAAPKKPNSWGPRPPSGAGCPTMADNV